ncbi:Centrosomal protein [Merluccius polli]|uniref:Centrosomal protein of 162 kDa n=1 Tax=Merluccius polli TaxID=89951 RepID=A0AA47P5E3_MERPO|nr:Centrosomal protein [Merluccius polli]
MSGLKKTKTGETQVSSINGLMRRRADSELASGPYLNPGGPGLETLEEEEEKARFFARLEAGASSTLDYSKLNRELDSTSSTAAASLRKPEEAAGESEEDQRPATESISPARADSPNYSDHFEDEESEKEPPEKTLQMSSLVSKVSLYDSLESTDGRAPSRQHGVKDPAVSVVDKGQSYVQSGGSEMEAVQEAYRQISDAPSDTEERGEGWSSRPSPLASPLEHNRGDHLPASTNGSELPTAEELMRPIRPETRDLRSFTLQPTSTSGPGLDLRPGSVERRQAGVKPGPEAAPGGNRGSSGPTSPDAPLRRRVPSVREEVERLMEDQDLDHDSLTPFPSTQASRAKQKPQVSAVGRPSVSSTRKTTFTSALRGSKAKEEGRYATACRFSSPNRPAVRGKVRGKASPPATQRKPVARLVQRSPTPAKECLESNAGPRVNDDLIASVQSFAAFLQKQVGATGPQVAMATWDVNARKDTATGAQGLAESNVEECSVVEGLAQKERDHLAHKESDLHLRLEEMKMQHREELSALKQENYVLQSKVLSERMSTDMYTFSKEESSSQAAKRWGEAADPMTKERLQLLEKEAQQQETIIQGYHQENEKLYIEMKAQQSRSRATEEAMFAENQRLLNELRLAKEQLKMASGAPLNVCPMDHTRRMTQLLAQMEAIQKSEAKISEESRSLRQQNQALEVDLQLMKRERDLTAQVLSTSGDKGFELHVQEDRHREEVAALQKKLRWYAENQQLLDRDAARLRAATAETQQLKEQLENLKVEVRKSSSQQHSKAKTGDAKRIQALERQVKELEDILRRRHPNSLPALIYAAAAASGPGGGDATKTAPPTQVTSLLERKIERLEAELDSHKEEAKRGLRAMEQQFQRIKLHYEQQISELEQKLVQARDQESAACGAPPAPPAEGSELQRVMETHRRAELALQEHIQSLQQQLSRKAQPTEPERVRRSPSRHQVQSEAAFGVRIERLTQELAAKTRSVQELSRTVERLQRERKTLLSGPWPRGEGQRPANATRTRAVPPGNSQAGGGGGGGSGSSSGGGGGGVGGGAEEEEQEREERFPAAQYEKTYQPGAFAGSHITEVLEENEALRERLGRLEEGGEPDLALAQAQEELRRLKESAAEQLSSLAAKHRLELDQLRASHAQGHSSTRVAQLSNALNTQEVTSADTDTRVDSAAGLALCVLSFRIVVQHLREQVKESQGTKDALAVSKIREETLQNQLTRLLEELRQAKEAQSPELRHLRSLEAKVHSMELRHTERENQLKQLIGQARPVGEAEQQAEVERWKRLAQGRGREVEAFRLELDAILDVLRELHRQGVAFPTPAPPLLNAPPVAAGYEWRYEYYEYEEPVSFEGLAAHQCE